MVSVVSVPLIFTVTLSCPSSSESIVATLYVSPRIGLVGFVNDNNGYRPGFTRVDQDTFLSAARLTC